MRFPKPHPVDLEQLQKDLVAAGIQVQALGRYDTATETVIHTYDNNGNITEVFPTGADTIIQAEVPPTPVDFGTDQLSDREWLRTTIGRIRLYQGLSATAVTVDQRKAYEDLTGSILVGLLKRIIGGSNG